MAAVSYIDFKKASLRGLNLVGIHHQIQKI